MSEPVMIKVDNGCTIVVDTGQLEPWAAARVIELIEYAVIDLNENGEVDQGNEMFSVTSNFGHRSQQPFVGLTAGSRNFSVQLTPGQAVNLAQTLISCAEASVQDAMMIRFFRERAGVDDPVALGRLLADLRAFRGAIEEELEEE